MFLCDYLSWEPVKSEINVTYPSQILVELVFAIFRAPSFEHSPFGLVLM